MSHPPDASSTPAEADARGPHADSTRSATWHVSPDLMGVLGLDGFFTDLNPAWTATLGWSEAVLKASPYSALIHPDDQASSTAVFQQVRDGGTLIRFLNRIMCRDGSFRWISWVAVQDGGRIHCTGRDVTAERGMQEERDRLWALSEDMLARADYSGTMTAVNPAWTKVLGFTEHELLTRPYAHFMHPDDTGKSIAALVEMGRTGLPTRFENRILTAQGGYKPIGWTVSPEPDGTQFIAVGRDLSDYKAREQELLQAQEALRQAHKMEAVGQLTGGIAHDFNNLLAAVSLALEMVTQRLARGDVASLGKYVAMAQTSVRRGTTLTQRLLAFSRRQTLDPLPTHPDRLVAGMEELVRRAVGPSVDVAVASSPGLWQVNVDVPQLENALLNLCINARDAMLPDGGRLTIETGNRTLAGAEAREADLPAGDYVMVCVADTGAGMTPDVAARAFDPFFTTKPLGQGTGLGLSMVYGFVRQSGGQVRVRSEPGQGTTITMYFPRHVGEAAAAETAPPEDSAGDGDGEVVLVVDDEQPIREVVAEVLELAGYRVLQAEDGPSGLKVLQSQRVDLLVTDVGLPGGMNGRQVADAARIARPDLRILFITGYAENAAVSGDELEPGMAVLTKPFDIAALGRKVEHLLGS